MNPVAAAPVDEAVDKGRAWLLGQQDAAGAFGAAEELRGRDTAAALEALASAGPGTDDPRALALDRAASFLSIQVAEAAQPAALRALGLAAAGRGSRADLAALGRFANGGGYGAVAGHASTCLDTAAVVRALSLEETHRSLEIADRLTFLLASQNADGGWGLVPGDASHPYFTAEVLLALAAPERLAVNPGAVAAAQSYLLSGQGADGGFGGVVETAVIFRALTASGADLASLTASPVEALLAAQRADGSWEGDVFTSAQVVLALLGDRPNLVIASASLEPDTAPRGTPVTLTATVRNQGSATAPASVLEVREGSVDGGRRGEVTVPVLEPGQEESVSVEVAGHPEDPDPLTLVAVADGGGAVEESSEGDNHRALSLSLRDGADLAVYPSDLTLDPARPTPDEPFELRVALRNAGETSIDRVDWKIEKVLAAGDAPMELAAGAAGPVEPGAGVVVPVSLSLAEGDHRLRVILDPADVVAETLEDNNTAERSVLVVDPSLPDLEVEEAGLDLSPQAPEPGSAVTVSALVSNVGGGEAAASVAFYEGDPAAGGRQLDLQPVSLPAGGETVLSTTFTPGPEAVEVVVVADPDSAVHEVEEGNNRASRFLYDLPDLAVGRDSLTWSPDAPLAGETVHGTVTLRNAGTAGAADVEVVLFDGDPAAGGTAVFTRRIPALAPGASSRQPFEWTASGGRNSLVVVVDGGDEVDELRESNNRVEREIFVERPAGADLIVADVDPAGLLHSAESLEVSGSVSVTVENRGDAGVAAPYLLRTFEDRDGDGRFSPGDRELASRVMSQPLAAASSVTVELTPEGRLAFHRSLVWVEVDATDAVPERREDDNLAPLFAACVDPPPAAGWAPVEEWVLRGFEVESVPVVVQLDDDNGDGRIDGRDVPDVVFHTQDALGRAITARSGLGGRELWTFRASAAYPVAGRLPHVAAADLDGDGVAEILGVTTDARLVALDHRGRPLWLSDPVERFGGSLWAGAPAVGDLNGDGVPEIAVGRVVLDAAGRRLAVGTANAGRNHNRFGPWGAAYVIDAPLSLIADLGGDGRNELVAGDAVYRLEGGSLEVVWDHRVDDDLMVDGYSAVGNLDADPELEIVYVSSNKVLLLNHDGSVARPWRQLQAYRPYGPYTYWAGPPSLADLDGDGSLEILVSAARELYALDGDLSTLWRVPSSEKSEQTAAVGFDLDGDGAAEVLYQDQTTFRILDGATGQTLHSRPSTSKTATEYPVVADVDGDGRAEILVPSNRSFGGDDSTQGLHVLGHPGWSGTRPVWGGHTFRGDDLAADGTVVTSGPGGAAAGNGFRTNLPRPAPPLRRANLTLGLPRVGAAGADGAPVILRVGNGGLEAVAPGVRITLHDGDPDSSVPVGEAFTTTALLPGRWEDVEVTWQAAAPEGAPATAVVDPDGAVDECDEADNRLSFAVTESVLPDLAIGAGDVVVEAPLRAGRRIPVRVTVSNAGAALAQDVALLLYDGDPDRGAAAVAEATVARLEPGAVETVSLTWDTLALGNLSATHLLRAVVDPADRVAETDEGNNRAAAEVSLSEAGLPDLALESVTVDPARVASGEPVGLTAAVVNRGAALDGAAGGFAVALGINGAEVERIAVPEALAFGESAPVVSQLDTLGRLGTLQVSATADPDGALAEADEGNNTATAPLTVGDSPFALELTTDRVAYGAGEPVTLAGAVTHSGSGDVSARLRLEVRDSAGAVVATLLDEPRVLAAGASQPISAAWDSTAAPAGTYTARAEVWVDGAVAASRSAPFSLGEAVSLDAILRADRSRYEAGGSALLEGELRYTAGNVVLQDLSWGLTVVNADGDVYFSRSGALAALYPGSSEAVRAEWAVGTAPAGAYTAQLRLRDAAGDLLAFASTPLEVVAGSSSGAGLEADLDLSPRTVGGGAPLVADLAVTHGGNADLPDLALRLDVLRVADGVRVAGWEATRPLARGEALAESVAFATGELGAGDHLVNLVAVLAGGEVVLDRAAFTLVPGVSVTDAAVAEGDAGITTVGLRVHLSEPMDTAVSVPWSTADGTARAGEDYEAASGSVEIPAGATGADIELAVFGDLDPEAVERFLVRLGEPSGALPGDRTALVEIRDEEGCAGPGLLVNPDGELAAGGDAVAGWSATPDTGAWSRRLGDPAPLQGLATFGLPAGEAGSLAQTVGLAPYATVTDAGGLELRAEVFTHLGADTATATLRLELLDAAGSVLAGLDAVAGASTGSWAPLVVDGPVPAGTRSARLVLTATGPAWFDVAGLVSVGTRVADLGGAEVLEGSDGPVVASFPVTLSCPATAVLDLPYVTGDGTALAGSDYTAADGTLRIAAGGTGGTVPVEVLGDGTDEPDEDFYLHLESDPTSVPPLVVLASPARGLIRDDDGPVTLAVAAASAVEGSGLEPGGLDFAVTLSAVSGRVVRVDYGTEEVAGGARAGEDFSATRGSLEIPAGETSATLRVPLLGDAVHEPTETLILRLSSPVGAELAADSAVGTVLDDDVVEISVGDLAVVEGDGGETAAGVPVTLSLPSVLPVSVTYASEDLEAVAGADYRAVSGSLTLVPGETSASVPVTVLGDLDLEGVERFRVVLGAPEGGILTDPEADVAILDDDGILLSVDDVALAESAAEAVFTVRLVKAAASDLVIGYGTADGTATAGGDYAAVSGSVTLPAGSVAATVTVPLLDDSTPEPAETFHLDLQAPPDAVLLDGRGTARLRDDDTWHLNGTADDAAIPGCIVLTPNAYRVGGSAWRTDRVGLEASWDKTYRVYLGTNDAAGGDGLTFTLQDDPRGRTSLGVLHSNLGYGGIAPSVAVEVDTEHHPGAKDLVADHVAIVVDGLLAHPAERPAVQADVGKTNVEDGEEHELRVVWNAAAQSLDAYFNGTHRTHYGADLQQAHLGGAPEVFYGLTAATGNYRNLQYFCEVDACFGTADSPAVSIGDARVYEGDSGSRELVFPVTLSCPSDSPVEVTYATADGTALAGEDYQAASGRLRFAPGETSRDLAVVVLGDEELEPEESFRVELSRPAGGHLRHARATGTLLPDEFAWRAEETRVLEGELAFHWIRVPVRLDPVPAETVEVDYTVRGGTAVAGADFLVDSGSFTLGPGSESHDVLLRVLGDAVAEEEESFLLELSPRQARVSPGEIPITILDDDACPSPNLLRNPSAELPDVWDGIAEWTEVTGFDWRRSVSSGFDGVKFFWPGYTPTAELRQDVDVSGFARRIDRGAQPFAFQGLLVSWPPHDVDASRILVEYRDAAGTVLETWDTGERRYPSPWSAVSDLRTAPPGTRTIRVRLVATAYSRPRNDGYFDALWLRALGVPRMSVEDVSVVEGAAGKRPASFPVRLSCPSPVPVSADYLTVDDTAEAGSDFTASVGTVTLAAGEVVTQVAVDVLGDTRVEGDERFYLNLVNPSAGVALGDSRAVATIVDDEATLSVSDLLVVESETEPVEAVFSVTLSRAVDLPVTVEWATADVTATAGADYQATTGTLTLEPGQVAGEIRVTVLPDVENEPDETFLLRLSAPSNAGLADPEGVATVVDEPVLTVHEATVVEGHSGSTAAVFRATLSEPTARTVSVPWSTADGLAEAGSDYHAASGTLTLAPGETTGEILVQVLGDEELEGTETFQLVLGSAENARLSVDRVTGYVLEDDDCAGPELLTNPGAEDTSAGTSALPGWAAASGSWVRRVSNPPPLAGAGYLHASAAAEVEAVQEVDLSAYATYVDRGTQRLLVQGFARPAADGDAPDAGRLALELVGADGALLGAVESREADDPDAWTELVELLPVPAGTRGVRLRLLARAVGDADTSADLFFDALSIRSLGTPVLLTDPPPAIREGEAPSLGFRVHLTCPAEQPVRFDWSVGGGTATAGEDYADSSGSVELAPGETERTLTVPLFDDRVDEDEESVYLRLSAVENAVPVPVETRAALLDDDAAPAVVVEAGRVVEGDGAPVTLPFAIRLTSPAGREITVAYSIRPGSARPGVDYTAVSGSVVFQPGEQVFGVEVPILGDLEDEVDEDLVLWVESASGALLLRRLAAGVIVDDDDDGTCAGPELVVNGSFESSPVGVPPGWTELSGDWRVSSNGPWSGGYFSYPGASSFGELVQEIDLQAYAGMIDGAGQTFRFSGHVRTGNYDRSRIRLDYLDAEGTVLAAYDTGEINRVGSWTGREDVRLAPVGTRSARVTLTGRRLRGSPNDAYFDAVSLRSLGSLVVSVGDDATGEADGQPLRFPVNLSCAAGDVGFDHATRDGSALAGEDYVATSGRTVIAAGDTAAEVTVPVLDDLVGDPGETLFLDLTGIEGAVGMPTSATGTIEDDEAVAVDLATCWDGSGSVGPTSFQLQLEGLARAIEDPTVIPRNGSVRLSAYQFSGRAGVMLEPTVVTAANYADLAARVRAVRQYGGSTNIASCIDLAAGVLAGTHPRSLKRVLDVSTDGRASYAATLAASARVVDDGIDVINAVGVGSADVNLLNRMVYPQPPGGPEGFVVVVRDFAAYVDAIQGKIRRETNPDLAVTKTDGLEVAVPGGSLTYTIEVANRGSGAVTAVLVDDPLPSILDPVFTPSAGSFDPASGVWSGLALDSGSRPVTLQVSGTVDPAATGTLVNTVSVLPPAGTTDLDPADNQATDSTLLEPVADLALVKSHEGAFLAGGTGSFRLAVTNLGPSAAAGPVEVTDAVPPGLVPLSAAGDGWACAVDGRQVSCTSPGGLAPGPAPPITLTVAVDADAEAEITNVAVVGSPTPDPNAANDAASDRVTPVKPSLRFEKTGTPADGGEVAAPGGEIAYEIVLANEGDAPLTGVEITDPLAPESSLVAGSLTTSLGTVAGSEPPRVEVGELAAGAAVTITLRARVDDPLPPGLEAVANQAELTSAELPLLASDDPSTPAPGDPTLVAVAGAPELTASKSAALADDADGDGVPSPGDEIAYEVRIVNRGTGRASGVVLTDRLPDHTALVDGSVTGAGTRTAGDPLTVELGELAAGAEAVVSFRLRVDDPVPAGVGEISNQGVVTSAELPALPTDDPALGGDEDPTVTPITATPELRAEKAWSLAQDTDGDGAPSPGDLLAYSVRLMNVGNTAATGVVFEDPVPDHATLVAGSVEAEAGTVTGTSPLRVEIPELPGRSETSVVFEVQIDATVPSGVDRVLNQGSLSAEGLAPVASDDPAADGAADVTVTPIRTRPELTAAKTALLFDDGDGDDRVSPDDVLVYRVEVRSVGNTGVSAVELTDALPPLLSLLPGTVQTSRGSVVGEEPVSVLLGDMPAGGEAVVTFQARVAAPFPSDSLGVSNQAVVRSLELDPLASDDPATAAAGDATFTAVYVTPRVRVEDAEVEEAAGPALFRVDLSTPGNRPVTVAWDAVPGTAGEADFTTGPGSLTVAPGETSAAIAVPVTDDLLDEPDETFRLRLTGADGGEVERGEAVGTILDDDAPPVLSLAGVEVTEGDDGTVTAHLAATLSAPSGYDVRFDWETSDLPAAVDAAVAGTDYPPAGATVVLPAGSVGTALAVAVYGDRVDEVDEVFRVRLSNLLHAVAGSADAAVTILDDDTAEIRIADASVAEGDDGTVPASLAVTLSLPSSRTVEVPWATAGAAAPTATAGEDFRAASGVVSVPPGETAGAAEVEVLGDRLDEHDERFTVELTGPTSGALADGVGLVTILDDDPLPALSVRSQAVTEGDLGVRDLRFQVALEPVSGRPVEVAWETRDGTATAGEDYRPDSGVAVLSAGTTRLPVDVEVLGDRVDEADEELWLVLSEPVHAEIVADRAAGTILDDDLPRISLGDGEVAEGDDGTVAVELPLSLDIPGREPISVTWATADGTAVDGTGGGPADYEAATGEASLAPGETETSVTVRVRGDVLLEPDETFHVDLGAPTYGEVADGEAVVTILDDEVCLGPNLLVNPGGDAWPDHGEIPGWTSVPEPWRRTTAAPEPLEGAACLAPPPATGAELTQEVDLTPYADRVDGGGQRFLARSAYRTGDGAGGESARMVVEYLDAGGTVLGLFDSGPLTSPGAWNVEEDVRTLPVGTRRARVRLLAAGADPLLAPAVAFDATLLASLRAATLAVGDTRVYEGDSGLRDANLPVRLACPVDHPVTASFATSDGSALAGEDYLATSGHLELPAGSTETTVAVPVVGDEVDEPHETFQLDLGLVAGALPLDPSGEATILNDDWCPRTPGYWKNHLAAWPLDEMVIGDRQYGADALLEMLSYGGPDATWTLAHHLVATELNLARGSEPSILPTVEEAHAFLAAEGLGSDPRGEARERGLALKDLLDAYNNTPCEEDGSGGGGGNGGKGGGGGNGKGGGKP